MITEHIGKGILESLDSSIDGRYLEIDFKATLKNNDYSEIGFALDWLNKYFLSSMNKNFVIDTYVEGINSKKIASLKENFIEAVVENNYCLFSVGGYKKTHDFNSLKKVKDYFDKNSSIEDLYSEWEDVVRDYLKNQTERDTLDFLLEHDSEFFVKAGLRKDIYLNIEFSTNRVDVCEFRVDIGVSVHILRDVEKTAIWFKNIICEIANNLDIICGGVKLLNNFNAYGTDEWHLYHSLLDSKLPTPLEYNYIISFEWVSLFSNKVISNEIVGVIERDAYSYMEKIGNNYILQARSPILEHRRIKYRYLYESLEKYLKPGFSKLSVLDLRPFFEDIWIPENQYAIIDETVYVCRGDFDFVKGMIEKDCAYSQYRECYNAVHNKRLIESERI